MKYPGQWRLIDRAARMHPPGHRQMHLQGNARYQSDNYSTKWFSS
jgi:hypothetical protein